MLRPQPDWLFPLAPRPGVQRPIKVPLNDVVKSRFLRLPAMVPRVSDGATKLLRRDTTRPPTTWLAAARRSSYR
jgi:hypothetical protein